MNQNPLSAGNLNNEEKNNSTAPNNPEDIWLDKQQVLQELHISSRTLQNWRSKGIIRYSKVLGKIYYRKSDIQMLLQKNIH